MSLGPFDLTGGAFLNLYQVLLAAALVACFLIPRWLRPAGRHQRVTDVDELALLAGGKQRFADAVVTRLLASGALEMDGRDRFAVTPGATGATAAERRLLALRSPIGWRDLKGSLESSTDPLEQRLVQSGLVMDAGERARLRFWATLPFALLVAFGAIKMIIGSARDRPIGYLTALVAATVVVAVVRWITVDRRTGAGLKALEEARERAQRIRRAPTSGEMGEAVALFGTAVLAGSLWEDYHRLRSVGNGSSGSSGSDGGGSDGGGGCGGGCGGCGGGGD
jgi:uncharacterized protein (TIGR04222 family)